MSIYTLLAHRLYDVGCYGKITGFNETPDKRYIINLEGKSCFKIIRELNSDFKFGLCEIEVFEDYNNNKLSDELKIELIDRFGLLPDAVKNLLAIAELKVTANSIKVKKIEAHDKGGFIEFYPNADINPAYLVTILQSNPQKFAMEGPTKLKFTIPLTDRRQRMRFVKELLHDFKENLFLIALCPDINIELFE